MRRPKHSTRKFSAWKKKKNFHSIIVKQYVRPPKINTTKKIGVYLNNPVK